MIEVLKQALDALETEVSIDWTNNDEFNASAEKMHDAIASLQQAIAELESQEPVAWVCCGSGEKHDIDFYEDDVNALPVGTMLYTHPPQRTWQGLMDEEIQTIVNMVATGTYQTSDTFARAIEAKLKQKNGYVAQETNS